MSFATASQPSWSPYYPPRIEDSQLLYDQGHIDLSGLVVPNQLLRFRRLVTEWRSETYFLSSVTGKTNHPAFKEIVGMGKCAVPWIIGELQTHRDFLFMALHLILKEDPTPTEAKGKPHKLIEAWLDWAERENIESG